MMQQPELHSSSSTATRLPGHPGTQQQLLPMGAGPVDAALMAAAMQAPAAAAAAPPLCSSSLHKPPLAPGSGRAGSSRGGLLHSPLLPLTPLGILAAGVGAWLRGLQPQHPDAPGSALPRFLAAAAEPDTARRLLSQAEHAAAGVFTAASGAGGGDVLPLQEGLAQERCSEALKVYHHALAALLAAEEARAGLAAAGALLLCWPFHASLLACSCETVVAAGRVAGGRLAFPAIPARLGLAPFDQLKLIGPFIRAEPGMPRELKRHLLTIEESVLEAQAWAPGSSLFRYIRAATGQQQQQQQLQEDAVAAAAGHADQQQAEQQQRQVPEASRKRPAAAAPGSSSSSEDAVDQDQKLGVGKRQRGVSPVGAAGAADGAGAESEPPLPAALGWPAAHSGAVAAAAAAANGASACGDPAAATLVHNFCRQVLKLAAFRLVTISDALDFGCQAAGREGILRCVHGVLATALYEHTHLFYGRQLDTLLLASLYGYCKVNRLEQVTFRAIITHYKRQPFAKAQAYQSVVLRAGPGPGAAGSTQEATTGDIIAFYNSCFLPAMKDALLATTSATPSPHVQHQQQQQQQQQLPSAAAGGLVQAAGGGQTCAAAEGAWGPATPLALAASSPGAGPGQPGAAAAAAVLGASPLETAARLSGRTPQAPAGPVLSPGSAYRALSLSGNVPPAGALSGAHSLGQFALTSRLGRPSPTAAAEAPASGASLLLAGVAALSPVAASAASGLTALLQGGSSCMDGGLSRE